MVWRLAKSLVVLRNEVNSIAPNRSKISDGTIGDTSHSNRTSDHNPDEYDVVRALDLTHDPSNNANMYLISEHIKVNRHIDLKYIIFDRRIASNINNWQWRVYSGSNPHTKHMHVSVKPYPYGDNEQGWLDEVRLDSEDFDAIRKIVKQEVVFALRQATGPDDGSVPAGSWFNEVRKLVRLIAEDTGIDVNELAKAIVNEFANREV